MELVQKLIRSYTPSTQTVCLSSSGSPVILFTRLLYYTKCQSRKRELIQPNIYRTLTKFNQFICTLHTIGIPNGIILAQRVLQIFCTQGPLWLKYLSLIKGQSNIHSILWKVNQVIYTMYPNCMPDIISLVQAVLQTFCSQSCFSTKYAKLRKGRQFSQILTEFCQKLIRSSYTLRTIYMPNIKILTQGDLQIFCLNWFFCT